MEAIRRAVRDLACALAGGVALLAFAPAAGEAPQARCQQDALGRWYCAKDAQGVAVVDGLGAMVCAPGHCIEVDDEWACSAVSGGSVALTPDGPLCDGGCRSPRAVDCEPGLGPSE